MKALVDDAVPIKKEPESDPIYRERSFTWANSKMNFHEKQEYNRMLWIIKGREAKDLMLEVPGGSELEHLWS